MIAAVAAILLLSVCVLLTRSLWAPGQNEAERANVLALPVGVLSLIASMVSGWFAWKALQPAPQLRDAARELRDAVRRDRERFIAQAMGARHTVDPARLSFGDPAPGALPVEAESLLLKWQDVDGGDAGSLDDVADFYRREPTGRLVVLGAPGAGKTVLLTRLILDLLDDLTIPTEGDLPDGFRVPVLFSLSSCDLRSAIASGDPRAAFHRWLAGQLSGNYGLAEARATQLVRRGHVLPVLDGLDEMDAGPGTEDSLDASRPRATALLDVLDAERTAPVVLACRETEYGEVAGDDGRHLLVDARHVTLRPLAAADVVAYLKGRFGGRSRSLPSRWQPVAAALEAEEPILQVMANPWQLFLAVTAYAEETSEPSEMVSMSAVTLEEHLVSRLVPAVVDQHGGAARPDWSADDVTAWLMHIAVLVRRPSADAGASPTDIHLPDLWLVGGRRAPRLVPVVSAAVSCLMLAFVASLFSFMADGTAAVVLWLLTAVIVILGIAVTMNAAGPDAPLTRLDLSPLTGPSGRRRFWRNLKRSALVGVVYGALGFIALGLAVDWPAGAIFGAAAVLLLTANAQLETLGGELGPAISPSTLVRQCVTFSAVSWVSYAVVGAALATSLVAFTSARLESFTGLLGLAAPLLCATALWLADGNGAVWIRYALGVRSAARRNLLPPHPARFLDWCVSVGLMRMAGNTIQFRHKQLQEWLIHRAARSPAAPPTG